MTTAEQLRALAEAVPGQWKPSGLAVEFSGLGNSTSDVRVSDLPTDAARLIALAPSLAVALAEAVEALEEPWVCSPDCLKFQGYGHHRDCVHRVPSVLARVAGMLEGGEA